ncbi:MAG TPA: RNA polymerase sigma factor [Tepidisphaeraceae bacterium]|nr:RNA polymerase sigma factor [Tepidisphaeraceae bacterium]
MVSRLRSGDRSAGEELIRRHHEPLLRYLTRLGGSAHLAEELVQQTWISVLEHLDQFRPTVAKGIAGVDAGGSSIGFKPWLFRIATNKANDLWRGKGRERNAHAGLRLIRDEELPDSSSALSGSEEGEKLRRAIDGLPEAQRQVVMLRYFSGLKFVEIAEIIGCPLNTALGRMHKAMIKLKKLMETDGSNRQLNNDADED